MGQKQSGHISSNMELTVLFRPAAISQNRGRWTDGYIKDVIWLFLSENQMCFIELATRYNKLDVSFSIFRFLCFHCHFVDLA